jgi:hypothetical protein
VREIRRSLRQAIAVEGSRGWKISKEKANHKIDRVVALVLAAETAVRGEDDKLIRRLLAAQVAAERAQASGLSTSANPQTWGHDGPSTNEGGL